MSAAPKFNRLDVVERGLPPNAQEAAIKLLEENEWIIKGLRKQNERLAEERLNAELAASVEIAKQKFATAQWYQRAMDLEKRVGVLEQLTKALADSCDRIANHAQGLPSREEFTVLKNDHYALSERVPL